MLETNTIHVVVVDIEEREQEGLAFVSCLRGLQRFYLLPVILLAKDDTYESLAFHVFHCFDYVIKPIEKNDWKNYFTGLMDVLITRVFKRRR